MNNHYLPSNSINCLNLRVLFLSLMLLLSFSEGVAAQVSITDSRGVQTFEQVPERVVALSWSMMEQALNLNIEPVGMADPQGYENWVVQPSLPAQIADVGLRHEPNLERIAQLQPQVILISDDQIDIVDKLESIAPVVHFTSFSEDHDNVQVSRDNYLALSALFDQQLLAQQRILAMDARISELGAEVKAHFSQSPPAVTVVRFLDTSRVAVYGDNSATSHVLTEFGIESEIQIPASTWGLALRKVPELGEVESGHLMSILPFEQSATLYDTTLWKAMPFNLAGRYHELPSMWTYGGALATGRIAELIAAELLAIEVEHSAAAKP